MNGAASGFSISRDGGEVRVGGDLTMMTAPDAVRQGEDLLRQAGGELVFDLAAIRHCDSAALAVLLEWRREAARSSRSLQWRNVPERLRQLARISELESVLAFD